MTDPEVKGDSAVRVYVPTDVRPEMLDGPEAQALRDELDETRAQLAEEQTAHATLRALWDARCGTIASVQARLAEAEGKLRHNVRAEAEFRALTADVNADRERELFATEEKLAVALARLTVAEGLLSHYRLAMREAVEGLDTVSEKPKDFARTAAIAIVMVRGGLLIAMRDEPDAFLAPRPEPACVCGHTKSQHSGHTAAWGEDMPTHCSQADGCPKYRPEPAKRGTP